MKLSGNWQLLLILSYGFPALEGFVLAPRTGPSNQNQRSPLPARFEEDIGTPDGDYKNRMDGKWVSSQQGESTFFHAVRPPSQPNKENKSDHYKVPLDTIGDWQAGEEASVPLSHVNRNDVTQRNIDSGHHHLKVPMDGGHWQDQDSMPFFNQPVPEEGSYPKFDEGPEKEEFDDAEPLPSHLKFPMEGGQWDNDKPFFNSKVSDEPAGTLSTDPEWQDEVPMPFFNTDYKQKMEGGDWDDSAPFFSTSRDSRSSRNWEPDAKEEARPDESQFKTPLDGNWKDDDTRPFFESSSSDSFEGDSLQEDDFPLDDEEMDPETFAKEATLLDIKQKYLDELELVQMNANLQLETITDEYEKHITKLQNALQATREAQAKRGKTPIQGSSENDSVNGQKLVELRHMLGELNDDLNDTADALEQLVTQHDMELETAKKEWDAKLEQQSSTYETQLSKLKSQLKQTARRPANANQTLPDEIVTLEATVRELEGTLNESRTELRAANARHGKELEKQQEAASAKLVAEKQAHAKKIALLEKTSKEYKDRLENVEKNHAKELDSVQKTIESEIKSRTLMYESTIADLKTKLRTDLKSNSNVELESKRMSELHGTVSSLQAELGASKQELDQIKAQLVQAKHQRETDSSDHHETIRKLKQSHSVEMKRLETTANVQSKTKDSVSRDKVVALETKVAMLEKSLESEKDRSKTLSNKVSELETEASAASDSGLEEENAELRKELANLAKQKAEALSELQTKADMELQAKSEAYENQIAQLRNETRALKEQQKEEKEPYFAQVSGTNVDNQIDEYETQIEQLREEVGTIRETLKSALGGKESKQPPSSRSHSTKQSPQAPTTTPPPAAATTKKHPFKK